MYKIDKSTWDQMSANKDKIVKQWVPKAHEIGVVSTSNSSINSENTSGTRAQNNESPTEIIYRAQQEAENIRKKAYSEGYEKGFELVKKKFEDISRKQTSQLAAILNEIDEKNKRASEEVEEVSLQLAITIAEKILNMKIENDDNVFVGLVRNAISMMDEDDKYTLSLNSREYERHFKNRNEAFLKELQSDVPITVIKDTSLTKGGLIIESDKSFIDASIDTQIEKISNSIAKRDAQYHEAL